MVVNNLRIERQKDDLTALDKWLVLAIAAL